MSINIKSAYSSMVFIDINTGEPVSNAFSNYLLGIMKEKDMSKSEVTYRAKMHDLDGYNIINGRKTPSRDEVLIFCIASGMTYGQSQKALELAGFPRLTKSGRDGLIGIFIRSRYTLWFVNEQLFQKQLPILRPTLSKSQLLYE